MFIYSSPSFVAKFYFFSFFIFINSSIQIDLNKHNKLLDSSNLKLEFCTNCDLYLGGLFPIHAPKYAREQKSKSSIKVGTSHLIIKEETNYTDIYQQTDDYNQNGLKCGEIKKERGIQRLEAMLYAIDLINNSTDILPNIKLGAKIYDTCDRDTIALEQCVNFISDHFLLNDDEIENNFQCEATNSAGSLISLVSEFTYLPKKKMKQIYKRKVIGVIGAASSSVSIQVANFFRLFQVPQISYASTSPELSNKDRFPYFSRILPSDTLQAEAMATLVHSLEWNYITTINEEGNVGGIDAFINNIKSKKICISDSYTLSQTASEDDVKSILEAIYLKKSARAVVMFLQDHNIRKLLEIVTSLNYTDYFLWVASDSWGTKKESIHSNEQAAESAITFSPKFYEIKEFNDYFEHLNPKTNTRNPWFEEFWEEQFNCTINRIQSNKLNKRVCTGDEHLNVTQDGFIHFVIDSVFAMAHAVQKLIHLKCGKITHKTEKRECEIKAAEIKGPELLKAIRNVEFKSITGRNVKFTSVSGDGLAPFEVFQFQKNEFGKYSYNKIAEWDSEKPFIINKTTLKWRDGTSELPRSVCKEECGTGEIKQGDNCCWVCVKCDDTQYVSEDRKKCIKCDYGFGPNVKRTNCTQLPIEYMSLSTAFSLVPLIFSSVGILFTCFCIAVFIRYNETPIIKASGRELCYVLLGGIMSCYLVTFPLVTKPTQFSCAILRFGVSLSLTVCLAALFTKTNRLSRIFNNSVKQVRQASYVSPQSQLVICLSIVSVQIVGILIWVVLSPPGISYDYDDPKRVILQCKTQNVHLVMSFAYSGFLAVLCTIYAVKTRKIPENFNEARFIGFTMYSICIIWIAFFPIYFGTTAAAGTKTSPKNNYKIQLTTMAMCLSLSATVILFCLFLPKLRVVLLKPDKNVRSKSKSTSSATVKLIVGTHNSAILRGQMKDSIMNTKNTNNLTALNHPSTTSDGTNADDLGSKCETSLIKPITNNSDVKTKNETESVVSFKIPELNNIMKETSNNNRLTESDYQLADSKLYKTPLITKIKLPNSLSIDKLKSIDQLMSNQTIQTKQFLIEKEMGEISFDHNNSLNFEGELTENAIKQVVDQCFDQLSKNNKITSACLSLSMGKPKESEAIALTNGENNSTKVLQNARNTLVEKQLDVLNEPTNTILLSSKNDVNELYSLKITFV